MCSQETGTQSREVARIAMGWPVAVGRRRLAGTGCLTAKSAKNALSSRAFGLSHLLFAPWRHGAFALKKPCGDCRFHCTIFEPRGHGEHGERQLSCSGAHWAIPSRGYEDAPSVILSVRRISSARRPTDQRSFASSG